MDVSPRTLTSLKVPLSIADRATVGGARRRPLRGSESAGLDAAEEQVNLQLEDTPVWVSDYPAGSTNQIEEFDPGSD